MAFYCPRCGRHYGELKTFLTHFSLAHQTLNRVRVIHVDRGAVEVIDLTSDRGSDSHDDA
jgi:hypothetical protein